ncbi:ubiquitin domain-containing protein 1-like isoform X2 [Conger conger]|uniref:ubiquitin domain-containing protein 1-like isoform X2 n=1 Tax=Conger conger TaxID=82655 RepID=UPI002A5A6AC9|nr:ubiquitin domain-containing protein 1-like isoform X2 [Conger conger]
MGGCVGSHHDSSGSLNENSDGTGVALGRNQPLKRDTPKWKSDYPMTDGQLRSKRDEFWDTAPAFDGRKEIWDALRAAAHAFESNDHELAQAIIDGASITLPHDCSCRSLFYFPWSGSGSSGPVGVTGGEWRPSAVRLVNCVTILLRVSLLNGSARFSGPRGNSCPSGAPSMLSAEDVERSPLTPLPVQHHFPIPCHGYCC